MTNTTFRLAPWADALYAMDTPWWEKHHGEVNGVGFKGLRVRGTNSAQSKLATRANFGSRCLNSGAGALLMAAHYGAELIYMLGYDCGVGPNGERHWHADHPKGLGNAGSLDKWPRQFADAAKELTHCTVFNASRVTNLTIFPCVSLDSIINYD